jgi:NSS family neurotransmitter:Na+ symporter
MSAEDNSQKGQRVLWASRMGFIFAAAGSAVGLGNIWKFPYITGVNGGGAFVLVYLACILAIGVPILLSEFRLGQATGTDPISAFRVLEGKKTRWSIVGYMGVLAAFVIMSFYSVVAGWCLDFVVRSAQGAWAAGEAGTAFGDLTGNSGRQIFLHLIFIAGLVIVVARGVREGIEKASDVLMPVLLLLLVGMLLYATQLKGFGRGVEFLFAADFSKISPTAIVSALGHAFFTLSLGMGAMITYSSYLPEDANLVSSSVWIVFMDTAIALVAGLVIFPIAFTFDLEPAAGPGLIFSTLPTAFAQLPGGTLLSTLFFLLLSFAAFTSAISLVEVVVASAVNNLGWQRKKATSLVCLGIFLAGIPVVYSGTFFDLMDRFSSEYLLPLGGLLIALYVGWGMDADKRDATVASLPAWMQKGWLWTLRIVTPALVGFVFLNQIFEFV